MKRIYLDTKDCSINDESIHIAGDTCHYLLNVLRMRQGDVFLGFDGMGKEYEIKVCRCEKKSITGTITSLIQTAKTELSFKMTVFQSIPKGNKMDFIVREISQLGVKRIVPVISSRVIGSFSEEKTVYKIERWEKIAVASSSVAGRVLVTEIGKPVSFKTALESPTDISILFWEGATELLRKVVKKYTCINFVSVKIFIGAEGGFSDGEVEMASHYNTEIASLGNRILKVETASVIATALTIYELENL